MYFLLFVFFATLFHVLLFSLLADVRYGACDPEDDRWMHIISVFFFFFALSPSQEDVRLSTATAPPPSSSCVGGVFPHFCLFCKSVHSSLFCRHVFVQLYCAVDNTRREGYSRVYYVACLPGGVLFHSAFLLSHLRYVCWLTDPSHHVFNLHVGQREREMGIITETEKTHKRRPRQSREHVLK
jgi:hypothetical protein